MKLTSCSTGISELRIVLSENPAHAEATAAAFLQRVVRASCEAAVEQAAR